MKNSLNKCPVCDNTLTITKYTCDDCHTEITGRFYNSGFSKLNEEQLDFIEIFVLKRGNIKEIEKELGISYPTVRNKLDNIISTLGHKVETSSSKIEILSMLDNNEISPSDATRLLKELE